MEKPFFRLGRVLAFGGLLGGAISTWLAPKGIAWYFSPPVDFGINCKLPIEWALQRLQWAQLGGIGVGILSAGILYAALSRRNQQSIQ